MSTSPHAEKPLPVAPCQNRFGRVAYEKFKDEPGLTRVATLEEIRAKDGNLSIPLYVPPVANGGADSDSAQVAKADLPASLVGWLNNSSCGLTVAGRTRYRHKTMIIYWKYQFLLLSEPSQTQ